MPECYKCLEQVEVREGYEFVEDEDMCYACTIKELTRQRDNLLFIVKEALAQSGCDGDLCNYGWHERAREAIATASEGP